jgi:hypothetical protein
MPVLNSYQGCDDLNEGEAREVELSQSSKTVLKLPLLPTEALSLLTGTRSTLIPLSCKETGNRARIMKLVDVSCQVSLYLPR